MLSVAPSFVPEAGTLADYYALAAYHYRTARPPAITQIWTLRDDRPDPAAVLVVARPPLSCHLRALATARRYELAQRALAGALVNQDFRTIARVIVRPDAQGRGLATRLVRHALRRAETRYTEAIAVKARTHPFFERAGMTRFDRPPDETCVRLTAALEYADLRLADLQHPLLWQAQLARLDTATRVFLWAELRRWAGPKAARLIGHAEPGDARWRILLEYARQRLMERPVYLIWERGGG